MIFRLRTKNYRFRQGHRQRNPGAASFCVGDRWSKQIGPSPVVELSIADPHDGAYLRPSVTDHAGRHRWFFGHGQPSGRAIAGVTRTAVVTAMSCNANHRVAPRQQFTEIREGHIDPNIIKANKCSLMVPCRHEPTLVDQRKSSGLMSSMNFLNSPTSSSRSPPSFSSSACSTTARSSST